MQLWVVHPLLQRISFINKYLTGYLVTTKFANVAQTYCSLSIYKIFSSTIASTCIICLYPVAFSIDPTHSFNESCGTVKNIPSHRMYFHFDLYFTLFIDVLISNTLTFRIQISLFYSKIVYNSHYH